MHKIFYESLCGCLCLFVAFRGFIVFSVVTCSPV